MPNWTDFVTSLVSTSGLNYDYYTVDETVSMPDYPVDRDRYAVLDYSVVRGRYTDSDSLVKEMKKMLEAVEKTRFEEAYLSHDLRSILLNAILQIKMLQNQ